MNQDICIRNEVESDFRQVEKLTREAFYNLYVPGCAEHYLVHKMRDHEDFIPELALVIECQGEIIGNIMYTKAKLVDETGVEKPIVTFGPLCISPKFQRRGYGKQLMAVSFKKALALGYDTVVIFGDPGNYVGCGFKSCKKVGVSLEDGSFPAAMLVKELVSGVLEGHQWVYYDSPVMRIDEAEAEAFDEQFDEKEKLELPCQEVFYILSHSVIR